MPRVPTSRLEPKANAGMLARTVLPKRKNRKRRSLREMSAAAWQAVKATAIAMLPATLATLALVALGGALFAGHRFLRTSPRFAIAGFEVTGTHNLTHAEVVAAAGVALGSNIFALDAEQVEKRLSGLPWIDDVAVHRQLPRTLAFRITERAAVAVVNADGLYLMDASGNLFKRADTKQDELAGLLVVSGVSRTAFRADPAAAGGLVRRAYQLAALWNEAAQPESVIGEVRVEHDDSLTFYTREAGTALHLGPATEVEVPVLRAMFEASHNSLGPAERSLVRAIYLDNQSRKNYVTIAFAK